MHFEDDRLSVLARHYRSEDPRYFRSIELWKQVLLVSMVSQQFDIVFAVLWFDESVDWFEVSSPCHQWNEWVKVPVFVCVWLRVVYIEKGTTYIVNRIDTLPLGTHHWRHELAVPLGTCSTLRSHCPRSRTVDICWHETQFRLGVKYFGIWNHRILDRGTSLSLQFWMKTRSAKFRVCQGIERS